MARKPKAPSIRPKENIVGENIRYLLEKRGESAAKLARAIGVYHKTVYFWIHGHTVPDSISRQKVCDYFSITEAQLFAKGLAIGVPSNKEQELANALVSKLNLQGIGPEEIERLSPERKKMLENLIKDWNKERSQQVQKIRAAQAGAGSDGRTDQRRRILLIDDEAQLSMTLRDRLQEMGYWVELAEDGEAGLRWIEEWKPDLILLDLLMEGVDGAEFLRRLHEKNQRLKVIVVSSFPSEMHPVYTGPYKIADYCQKPVRIEELMDKIAQQIGGPA